jgi:uncharacterized protein
MLVPEHQSVSCKSAEHSGTCLRIYIGKSAHSGVLPTYEAIVLKAREMALSGATVMQGATGFGKSGKLHTQRTLHIVDDMPVVIEIVDDAKHIEAFLPVLGEMMRSGLVTLQAVQVLPRRLLDSSTH